MGISLIITAAGKGERAKQGKNKLLIPVNGKTCLERTFNAFNNTELFNQIIITASKEDFNEIQTAFPTALTVLGGDTRCKSVKNALLSVSEKIVLIHDGARPFIDKKIIENCIKDVKKYGNSVVAVNSKDTVYKDGYLGKDCVKIMQTPQGFITKDIIKAHSLAERENFNDDGEVYEKYIAPLHFTEGSYDNVKITYPEDFNLFYGNSARFGTGFDCHRLVENRKLILGGIEIPHDKGLLGHSDADVLTHAIMDAILSASANRDIGYHFPDSDEKYKDANSMKLLGEVLQMTAKKGYAVQSISAVIQAEKPKLKPYIPKITENLSKILNITPEFIGIGATTLEGLGFVGREEGICVSATAVLVRK